MVATYNWDTKEQQKSVKPYMFRDLDRDFLSGYSSQRDSEIVRLSPGSSASSPRADSYSPDLTADSSFKTKDVIRSLESINLYDQPRAKEHYDRILKKVEVRKLRDGYDSSFKNISAIPLDFDSWSELALLFSKDAQEGNFGHLQSLSTLLKTNDYLISELGNLSPYSQDNLRTSLLSERSLVSHVVDSMSSRVADIYPELSPRRSSPQRLSNLGMLLQDTNRSKAYLQTLISQGNLPSHVLLVENREMQKESYDVNTDLESTSFDLHEPLRSSLNTHNIPYSTINAKSVNEDNVVAAVAEADPEYFAFSGSGILKEILHTDKKIIHVHPGKLPEYRGSTCFYYSSLAENSWDCTSFVMAPGIDQGEVILSRSYNLPAPDIDPARIYDPLTRALTLGDVVQELRDKGNLETTRQNLSQGIDHYIIHPVLRHLSEQKMLQSKK
jgi:methionyl-tRNA formyltransferase